MPDDANLRINEFLRYLKKLNSALDAVAYGAKSFAVTFEPRVAVILGDKAEFVTNNLYQAGKIKSSRQISLTGKYARKSYIVEFYDM